MTVIGIDPGASGAIAWFSNDDLVYAKTPDTLADLWEVFVEIKNTSETGKFKAFIEQVHSSPQMGVKSAFTFGNGFGHLEMALTASQIPFERVRPQVWQKYMGCMTKGNKGVSKAKAQELFPHIKCTHAISDAMLIAEYGRRIYKNG